MARPPAKAGTITDFWEAVLDTLLEKHDVGLSPQISFFAGDFCGQFTKCFPDTLDTVELQTETAEILKERYIHAGWKSVRYTSFSLSNRAVNNIVFGDFGRVRFEINANGREDQHHALRRAEVIGDQSSGKGLAIIQDQAFMAQ